MGRPTAALIAAMLVAGALPATAEQTIPSQADWDGARQSVALSGGPTLTYVQLAEGSGTPVLLIHGYTDNSRSWSLMAPDLAAALPDRPIYAIDLRGHGGSDVVACCYGLDSLSHDVVGFMDALALDQVDLVGHSLGAMTAAVVAGLHGNRVGNLVLISTAMKMPAESGHWLWSTVPDLSFPLMADSDFMQDWYWNPNPVDADFLSREMTESAARPQEVWMGVLEGLTLADWSPLTRRLSMPTLILWGDQDSLFGAETQDALQAALPEARFETFAGYGHNMFWETPDRAAAMIADFLTD